MFSTIDLLILLATICGFILWYFQRSYKYWDNLGVPTLPFKFPYGNAISLLPRGSMVGILVHDFYKHLKAAGKPFGGVYLVTDPRLVLVDPEYIKDIMSRDFEYFVDRGMYHNEKHDPISAHLFAQNGKSWRTMRTKLTPTFTSGKMKMMFATLLECAENMRNHLNANWTDGRDVDIKDIMACFTTDVIGSCAFGINCNSFKHPDAEFRQKGREIFEADFMRLLNIVVIQFFPDLALKMGLCFNRPSIRKFFTEVVKETLQQRHDQGIRRDDFLQILIDLKDQAAKDETLKNLLNSRQEVFTDNEIAAQVFLFFIAGFETSSTALSFGFYELARNQDIQDKVRQEVNDVVAKNDGKITYDSLKDMKYLQQVLDETLRMYPPLPSLSRKCVKPYKLRDTEIVLEKGTTVLIPAIGLHMDPDYYPDPEKFNPDRFQEEEKKNMKSFTYLPFGDGPRNCIGLRFGLMQSRIALATIIKNFRVVPSANTKEVEFDKKTFLLNSVNKVYVKLEKI